MIDDNVPDGKMSEMEFLRARFFSPDGEIEALKAADVARLQRRKERAAETRKFRAPYRALQRFVLALEAMHPRERRAMVGWLSDKYIRDAKYLTSQSSEALNATKTP